jgi:hypothetical protein
MCEVMRWNIGGGDLLCTSLTIPYSVSALYSNYNLGCQLFNCNVLEKLQSYGFRGEALSAICRVADVTVTTRTSEDEFATAYTLNNDGNIVTAKPSHFSKGKKNFTGRFVWNME